MLSSNSPDDIDSVDSTAESLSNWASR